MLNQDPRPCPACSCNASRRNEETFCTAWNVVTHATDLNSRSCFVLSRVEPRVKVGSFGCLARGWRGAPLAFASVGDSHHSHAALERHDRSHHVHDHERSHAHGHSHEHAHADDHDHDHHHHGHGHHHAPGEACNHIVDAP